MKRKISELSFGKEWSQWCRLCSKEDSLTNVDVFFKDELATSIDLKLSVAIAKYFSVNITPDDELSKMICTDCFSQTTAIVDFTNRVNKVQAMFSYLQKINPEMANHGHEIRLKFGLVEEDCKDNISFGTSLEPLEKVEISQIKIESPQLNKNDECGAEENNLNSTTDEDSNWKDCDKDVPESNEEELSPSAPRTRRSIRKCKERSTVESQTDDSNSSCDDDTKDVTVMEEEAPKNGKKRKFSCKLCSRKFNAICYYRQHMRRTHKKELDVPQFKCEQCSKSFPTELQFRNHNKTHLPLELKQDIPCVYCDKKFTTPYVMQKHISAVHLNEKPYICEECGIAVKSSSSLKVHMLTHTEDRPWRCSICGKGFKNRVGLKRHMDGHSSNKHVCSECGCQLNSKASLRRHMVIHSDEKLHKCDYCGREFKRPEALKHHLILHTGLKPYACNFCGKTFANGSNCRAHKKKTHPEELAALEASGEATVFTKNIPKLEQLKAITKASDNLNPVVSKQSGASNYSLSAKRHRAPAPVVASSAPLLDKCWPNDDDQQLIMN